MRLIKIFILISIAFSFSGCLSKATGLLPIDETFDLTKKSKTALVIGSIEDDFLTDPKSAYILIKGVGKTEKEHMLVTTNINFYAPDFQTRNCVGFYFVFQIPEGEYRVDKWLYRYYDGISEKLNPPVIYNFKNGKVYYIGHFFANAVTMSLALRNNFKDDVAAIKNKYKNFPQEEIINLSKNYLFERWKIKVEK